jgi:hypothetical protein
VDGPCSMPRTATAVTEFDGGVAGAGRQGDGSESRDGMAASGRSSGALDARTRLPDARADVDVLRNRMIRGSGARRRRTHGEILASKRTRLGCKENTRTIGTERKSGEGLRRRRRRVTHHRAPAWFGSSARMERSRVSTWLQE